MKIHRFKENPLIEPDLNIPWMTENAFNPGVIRKDNKFYMLIRGGTIRRQYHQRYSDLGLATSQDGIHWNIKRAAVLKHTNYLPDTENGIEDPRIVLWNNEIYIFATACHKLYGRVGIWKTKDFHKFDYMGIPFDWEDKDACIIPKVINGKVYMIHRLHPNMWISESSNQNLFGWKNHRKLLESKEVVIDGKVPLKVGINGPPMKVGGDWFVMFHAVIEPFEYRSSFMILDGNCPDKIKYIHPKSIFKPELPCEKRGAVPYVCFNNAIVDMGDRWYLYWGGADSVICGGFLLKNDIRKDLNNV